MGEVRNAGVSLSGASIPVSLSLLREGGCFIEMGKRETWDAAKVAAERPDVKFVHFDLAQLIASEPQRLRAMLIDVMGPRCHHQSIFDF